MTSPNLMSAESLPGVCEIHRFGPAGAPANLLIELPHGATERSHYDSVAAQLGSALPLNLEEFFHVNTDFGVPEMAFEIAARLTGAARKAHTMGVVIVRALVPRTFIDFNRAIGDAAAEPGMTPGLPPYITAEADQQLLLSLYQQYRATVAGLYGQVCGPASGAAVEGGLAVALHSYSPRSVEVSVDADIVTALRDAYRHAVYSRWSQRPGVDFITQDVDGHDLSPPGLVSELRATYSALGLTAGENTSYRLHPATMGFRYASSHPGQVLCAEFRRDLMGAPWRPFTPSRVGPRKIARLARPLADALAQALSSR
ncbi:MAG: hypothetical protein ABIV06_09095 [Thermoanaerobaculia bacterium]